MPQKKSKRLSIRCTAADLATLDRIRGDRNRAELVLALIHEAAREAPSCRA